MPEKTSSFLKSPQAWIIVILLAVIAAFAFSHFNKPKPNRLQQAAAHFDAIEAEERAEAEKEKARLAEIAAAKAEAEAKAAADKLRLEEASRLAREATAYLKQQNTQNQQAPSRYAYFNTNGCSSDNRLTSCYVICRDQYESSKELYMSANFYPSTSEWSMGDGFHRSLESAFNSECQKQ